MIENTGNKKTVWVVYNDTRKDMSKAEEFGNLKDIFSTLGRNYDGAKLIEYARHVLSKSKEGDYLLIVGDPTLCGICMAVMAELQDEVNVLRWDRDSFRYTPLKLNFNYSNQ